MHLRVTSLHYTKWPHVLLFHALPYGVDFPTDLTKILRLLVQFGCVNVAICTWLCSTAFCYFRPFPQYVRKVLDPHLTIAMMQYYVQTEIRIFSSHSFRHNIPGKIEHNHTLFPNTEVQLCKFWQFSLRSYYIFRYCT